MSDLSVTYPSFSPGAKVKASEHNTNNSDITTWLNARNQGTSGWDALTVGAASSVTGAVKLHNSSSAYAVTLSPASFAAARTYTIPDNGVSSSFIVAETAQKLSGHKPFGTRVKGLKISKTGNSTNHVLWDYVALADSSGHIYVNATAGSIVTSDISGNGAVNSLDTGSVASNTWYYIYVISNGTNTGALYSLSATSPTMPSGYTYKMLVGAVRTDGSSNILESLQTQEVVTWGTPRTVVSNDTTNNNVLRTIDISAAIPPLICWNAYCSAFLSATYAAAGARSLVAGLARKNVNGGETMFDVIIYQSSTQIQMSGRGFVSIANESADGTDCDVDYTFVAQTANLSSYTSYLYVNSYSVSILGL